MKLSQHGDFSEGLEDRAKQALTYRFSEVDEYSFATCERPDGSRYGTSGQCRKGTETSAKEEKPAKKAKRPLAEISAGAAEMYIRSGQRQLEDAKAANDRAGMMKAMRMIKTAQKQLAEAKKREAADAANVRPFPAPKQPSVKEVGTAEQRMVMKRLEERLDNAVTINEQQRISNAISELRARMG